MSCKFSINSSTLKESVIKVNEILFCKTLDSSQFTHLYNFYSMTAMLGSSDGLNFDLLLSLAFGFKSRYHDK